MQLTVLGCAGGIGGHERLTTCLRLDRDIVLDAGTGIADLAMDELVAIDHVFLTHPHLDHVAGLAFLLDAVLGRRETPVVVHATAEVTSALQQHVFNWVVWPDFTQIPDPLHPTLRWEPCSANEPVAIGDRIITAYQVDHTVPAVAYVVVSGNAAFVYSGDMSASLSLWKAVREEQRVQMVIVDCSFPNAESGIARLSKHYCPSTLVADIAAVPARVAFYATHLKPGSEDLILAELRAKAPGRTIHALTAGDRFML